ncbi:MAG TPA: TonB-dependent receptor plug domain-containing protein [Steroidobacteraceae bacterium]|nr:TonB-dependent receptor plug domain-containing protein [Steroidobacteraceae bacterium]
MKGQSRRISGTEAVLLSGLGLICAIHANAQSADQAAGPAPLQLQQVVVTGTLIPTNPDAVAVPVTSLDASTLAATGISNDMLASLEKTVPAFAGRSNAGSNNAQNHNQFTAGGSQIELRNLPTLVLLNGQRLALDAVAGLTGSKDFVDVSQIPAAALERVDVLTDGASSLYGSDAIGGVVNFILKHDYHGVTFGTHYGTADGGYRDRSAFVTAGGDVGPVNVTATASYAKTTPLWADTRAFSSPKYGVTPGTALPGTVAGGAYALMPGLTFPSVPTGTAATAASYSQLPGVYYPTSASQLSNAFDFSKYSMLLQQEEHKSFVANITSKPLFGGSTELFGDVLASQNKVVSTAWQTSSQPFSAATVSVPAGSPYDPLTTATTATFADLNRPKGVYDTTDAYQFTLGLKGHLTRTWTWQTSVDYSESKLAEDDTNLIYKPNLAAAVAGGYDSGGVATPGGAYSEVYSGLSKANPMVLVPALDPFAVTGNPAATLANVYGTEMLHGDSKLYSWDGHAVGNLFRLPAGPLSLAIGASWRREEVSGHADPNGRNTDPATGLTTGNDQNWQNGVYTDPFSHGRDDSAAYAETRIPVFSSRMDIPGLDQVELTAAGRFEHYSDAGSATDPKFGFRWAPFDSQFAFNGNYTKSFVAPPLFQAYGPYDTRQVTGAIPAGAGVFGEPALSTLTFNGEDGNNPSLKPAIAVARSIGFTFRPKFANGLTVNADFSSINLYGFAGGIGFNNIFNSVNRLGSASPFFNNLGEGNFINFGGTDPFTAPGALKAYLAANPANLQNLYVEDRFTNLAVLRERSWNLAAMYILPWSQYGTWTLSTNTMAFDSYKFSDGLGDAPIQYAGNASNLGVFAGTLPKYRFYTTLDWSYRSLAITLANTYIASVADAGAAGTGPVLVRVPRYSSFDLHGSYTWQLGSEESDRKVVAAIGINDLNNASPPYMPNAFSNAFMTTDIGTYSPIEREVYGDLTVSF